MIAEEDKHASSQRCTHGIIHCSKRAMSSQACPRWLPTSIQTHQILTQCTYLSSRSHRPRMKILSNWQLCDFSVRHHDNRNDSETEILFDKRPPQVTEFTRTQDPVQPFFESARETRCTHVWNQHGETRCVITVTKNKSLVLISEYKEDQNSRQATRSRKRPLR